MNRQERYAYELGWAARNLNLPAAVAMDLPLYEDEEVVVEPGPAWRGAAWRGWNDAVCVCGHVEIEHERGYGCHAESVDLEGIECPCTRFESAAQLSRQAKRRKLAQMAQLRDSDDSSASRRPNRRGGR